MPKSSSTVANRFVELAINDGKRLDAQQLMTLTYLAHGWSLGRDGQALTNDPVEAWKDGPGPDGSLSARQEAVVAEVYTVYGHLPGPMIAQHYAAEGEKHWGRPAVLLAGQIVPDLRPSGPAHQEPEVKSALAAVRAGSAAVYGDPAALDSDLQFMRRDPRKYSVMISRYIAGTPERYGPLAGGRTWFGMGAGNSQRVAAEQAVPGLAAAVRGYGTVLADAQATSLMPEKVSEHRRLQARLATAIPAPSKDLTVALAAPRERQVELFGASRPLREELTTLNRAISARLAPADHAAINKGDMAMLSASLGAGLAQAARIATVRNQAAQAADVVRNQVLGRTRGVAKAITITM